MSDMLIAGVIQTGSETLNGEQQISGVIAAGDELVGELSGEASLIGEMYGDAQLDGELSDTQTLEGILAAAYGTPGRDGKDGKDGYTPVKGIDYFDGKDGVDGYTPVKGVDYFDGKDGYTPIKGVDYFDGLPGADGKDGEPGKDGYTPIKGVDYFDGEKGDTGYTPIKGVDYFDGKDGVDGYTPVKGVDYFDGERGPQGIQGIQGIPGEQGVQGPRGERGEPFFISKVYPSVNAMHLAYATDEVPEGGFVVIDTGNVDDEDNAKLFYKGSTQYEYLTDLSGAQGIQGPAGEPGIQGVPGVQGIQGVPGVDGQPGKDGYTPQRGKDYWTDADKAEIVQQTAKEVKVPNKTSELTNDSNFVTLAGIKPTYFIPYYEKPTSFGCTNTDDLTTIVTAMPNNSNCTFWINASQFPTVYNEIHQFNKNNGLNEAFGCVTLEKRSNVVRVKWECYRNMFTVVNSWTSVNNRGWAGWMVLIPYTA